MDEDEDAPEGEDEAVAAEDEGSEEDTAIEATAREQGWKPKSEWKSSKDWVDADEYVRRGNPRYLREQLEQTEKQVRKLEQQRTADQTAFEQRLTKMETLNKVQRRKMYAEIESTRRAAAEVGDLAEYDRQNEMEQQLYQAEQEAGKETAKEDPAVARVENPEILQWISENPWFNKNKMLAAAAGGISDQLADDEPGLTMKENLAKTRAEVIKRFPEKFSKAKTNGNGHSAVESGQRSSPSPKGKGFTDIPSEERRVMEGHIKEGLYKDKADAATAYWSQ
jgi:hypothetical protein